MSASVSPHAVESAWPQSKEQQAAYRRFQAMGLPTQRDEEWRYAPTDEIGAAVTSLLADPVSSMRDVSVDIDSALAAALPDVPVDSGRALVLVNGRLADSGFSGNGWTVSDNGVAVGGDTTAMAALNAACNARTIALTVDGNSEPLHIVHVVTAQRPTLASPRLHVTVPANVSANVVEHLVQLEADAPTVVNAAVWISLQSGAALRWHRLQCLGNSTLSVYETNATLESEATMDWFSLDTGAALARNHMRIALQGEFARADLSGVYLSADQQVIDNRLAIRHAQANASSSQEYAGIAGGESRAIFQGKVRVDEGADGTKAKQRNRNLLMSDTAKVYTKPELEIYADEVECAHGATTGQIDPDALFYLLARGIHATHAKRMLVDAFVAASLAPVNDTPLAATIQQRLADKLAQLQPDVSP
ncbi:MAG: Fe-S cluster assembly protein SufD [Pseudomonadota bacterium]